MYEQLADKAADAALIHANQLAVRAVKNAAPTSPAYFLLLTSIWPNA